jgi:hypothetical protein
MPIPETIQKAAIALTPTRAIMLLPTQCSHKQHRNSGDLDAERHNRKSAVEYPDLACLSLSRRPIPSVTCLSLHREESTSDLTWKLARFAHVATCVERLDPADERLHEPDGEVTLMARVLATNIRACVAAKTSRYPRALPTPVRELSAHQDPRDLSIMFDVCRVRLTIR